MRRVLLCPLLLALLALLAGAAPPPAGAAASDWSENPESRVRLITPYRVAPVGQEVWLGLHFRLAPEWHVYWKNSGDAGFPPVIDLTATPELGEPELLWPAPERYELPGDLVAFGYEDEVVYPVRARLGDGVSDPLEIAMVVDYLVCQVDCIPYRYTLRLSQRTGPPTEDGAEDDPETAPLLARWRDRLPRPVAEVAGVSTRGWLDLSEPESPVLDVTVTGARAATGAAGGEGEPPRIFLESHELYDLGTPELRETADGLGFRVPLDPLRALDEAPATATFAWTVTGLALPSEDASTPDESRAGSIEARQSVPAGPEPPGSPEPPVGHEAPAEHGPAAAGGGPAGGGPPLGAAGAARVLARAFVGGLLLAVTPAALALLFLLVGELRYGRGTGARTGAAVAGAVASPLVLAAAGLATGGDGWGALLREPWAVTALAVVTLLFSLRLWGLAGGVRRTVPEAVTDRSLRARYFGLGLLLPLLAAGWPVPPGPAAVDAALASGPVLGLATVAVAALGLAAPLFVPFSLAASGATFFTPRRRSGTRTEEIAAGERSPRREALGFLAALSVVWLLYLLSGLVSSEDLAFVEFSLLGVGLGAWARRRAEDGDAEAGATGAGRLWPRVWTALALFAAAAALWIAGSA
jgi:DsbC/DsbD-like thiol-disulfide interchange protein